MPRRYDFFFLDTIHKFEETVVSGTFHTAHGRDLKDHGIRDTFTTVKRVRKESPCRSLAIGRTQNLASIILTPQFKFSFSSLCGEGHGEDLQLKYGTGCHDCGVGSD
jgi:hypothetical protein